MHGTGEPRALHYIDFSYIQFYSITYIILQFLSCGHNLEKQLPSSSIFSGSGLIDRAAAPIPARQFPIELVKFQVFMDHLISSWSYLYIASLNTDELLCSRKENNLACFSSQLCFRPSRLESNIICFSFDTFLYSLIQMWGIIMAEYFSLKIINI